MSLKEQFLKKSPDSENSETFSRGNKTKSRSKKESRSVSKMPPIYHFSPYIPTRDLNRHSTFRPFIRNPSPHSTPHPKISKIETLSKESESNSGSQKERFTPPSHRGQANLRIQTEISLKNLTGDGQSADKYSQSTTNVKKSLKLLTKTKNQTLELNRNHSSSHLSHSKEKSDSQVLTREDSSTKKIQAYPKRKTNEEFKQRFLKHVNTASSERGKSNEKNRHLLTHHEDEFDDIVLPDIGATKHSLKGSGAVIAYAANTNPGLIRNYNEDRVSIILNISKPSSSEYQGNWPICSYFGIFDGHGGTACADFLRDNLHQMIVKNSSFPSDPAAALKKGFAEAEAKFLEIAQESNFDRSGSCAIVVLIVGKYFQKFLT